MNVLITGATSGIGAATATKFAQEGHNLWLVGRRTDRLISIKESLQQAFNVTVLVTTMDVQNRADFETFALQVEEKWGAPDILINNAGLALGVSAIQDGDIDQWETMIDTNVKGLLYATRNISPLMKTAKKGHIINIGSTAGKIVYPNGNVYCATKHAVDALSQSMRIDLLPFNIKVTAINPGMVNTEFSLVRFDGNQEKANATYLGFNPLEAEDIANTIYFCASLPEHVCINDLTVTCTRQANGIFKTNDEAVANS